MSGPFGLFWAGSRMRQDVQDVASELGPIHPVVLGAYMMVGSFGHKIPQTDLSVGVLAARKGYP